MGFYNMIFGENKMADMLLAILGKTKGDFGRYRDCYISNGMIAVYTRNGGGNREHFDWIAETESGPECGCTACMTRYTIPRYEWYSYDEDDEFDSTYATFYFSFPEQFRAELEAIDSGEKIDPSQKWLDAIEAIRNSA